MLRIHTRRIDSRGGVGAVATAKRIKIQLDSVAVTDSHDHVWLFTLLAGWMNTSWVQAVT